MGSTEGPRRAQGQYVSDPTLSIVLCTRNRADSLRRSLARYENIAADIGWELIVVDNGSADATSQVLQEFSTKTRIRVRLATEPRAGLSRARNAGWQCASGEIIAFTDDDCYPESGLVTQLWRNFSESEIGYLGGRVLLYDPADFPITIQARHTRLDIAPRSFIPAGLIQGANMAVRREVLRAVGGFDEHLGAGTRFPSEDVDFVSRVSAAGYPGAYDPRPVVFHHHRRRAPKEVNALMRSYDFGRGAYYMKCLLDPSRRFSALKSWYWSIRGRLRHGSGMVRESTLHELRGASAYLLGRLVWTIRRH